MARILGIPPALAINRVIGFGYIDPARTAAPASVARPRLSLDDLVHWDGWGQWPAMPGTDITRWR